MTATGDHTYTDNSDRDRDADEPCAGCGRVIDAADHDVMMTVEPMTDGMVDAATGHTVTHTHVERLWWHDACYADAV